MSAPDIVNAFFRRHYPADAATAWESEWCGNDVCRRYTGDRARHPNIFPEIVCADGLTLSVQGHFGAYSSPRDDFANNYDRVEVMGPPGVGELTDYLDCKVGDRVVYAYVPTHVVCDLVETHGGIAA